MFTNLVNVGGDPTYVSCELRDKESPENVSGDLDVTPFCIRTNGRYTLWKGMGAGGPLDGVSVDVRTR